MNEIKYSISEFGIMYLSMLEARHYNPGSRSSRDDVMIRQKSFQGWDDFIIGWDDFGLEDRPMDGR